MKVALEAAGHTVTLAGPLDEQSGSGAAINAGANIGAATQLSGTVGGTIVAIANGLNGSLPAIGISTDEPCDEEEPPGDDLAACVAANAAHYANVASFLADFIAHLESKPGFLAGESGLLPAGVALNINYPPLAPEDTRGSVSIIKVRPWCWVVFHSPSISCVSRAS